MKEQPDYKHPLHLTWRSMKTRCFNANSKSFKYYGAKGVTVCERWMSFQAFLEDMGPKPSQTHTLDRINNHGNYEPGNVRWATWDQQRDNQSGQRHIEFDGERMCIARWARRVGISKCTLRARLITLGWPVEKALTTPVRVRHIY